MSKRTHGKYQGRVEFGDADYNLTTTITSLDGCFYIMVEGEDDLEAILKALHTIEKDRIASTKRYYKSKGEKIDERALDRRLDNCTDLLYLTPTTGNTDLFKIQKYEKQAFLPLHSRKRRSKSPPKILDTPQSVPYHFTEKETSPEHDALDTLED
jgi:hypothetical protein